MWIAMSERYREERQKYNLKECCEDCRHFCPSRQSCAVIYPVAPHLKQTFLAAEDGDRIYFCKMFEAEVSSD